MLRLTYVPEPIDLSQVQLPSCVEGLLERLAKNTHEVWAAQRIAEGWSYGPERSDPLKQHPCLVPYEQLPEEEREYDRLVSSAALKTILAMGYTIHKEV